MSFDYSSLIMGPDGKVDPGKMALIQSLIGVGGGIASGIGQGKEAQANRDFTAQQNTQQQQFQGQQSAQQLLASMITNQYNQGQSNQLSRDQSRMNASQLNPLAQQEARAKFALQGDKVNQWTPTTANFDYSTGMGGFSGGYNAMKPSNFTKSFYTPEAMANAEMQDFQTPLQALAPGSPVANNYGKIGEKGAQAVSDYGQGLAADRATADDNYSSFAQKLSQQITDQQLADKQAADAKTAEAAAAKKGSSWKKKLAKIGILVGGAALMATGVGGPAGAALISAGMGAGNGAIDGGVKGALLGGALGAATGGLGGGAASSAIKQGFGSALKSELTNPAMLAKIGTTAMGGGTGMTQLAGSLAQQAQNSRPNAYQLPSAQGVTPGAYTYGQAQNPFYKPAPNPYKKVSFQ